jgi:hypothetical protein
MNTRQLTSDRRKTHRTLRSTVRGSLAVLGACIALAAVTAGPASAATGHVWVIYNNSHCVAGGNVTGIYAAVDNVWATPPTGDWGDNVIYPAVQFGRTNTISAHLVCSRPWYRGGSYGLDVQNAFYPTANGQNFWF